MRSKAEVKALLEAPPNLPHRAMRAPRYGAGLRVSEGAHGKVSDLDRGRRVIWVRGGKGHQDRPVRGAEPRRDLRVAYGRWKRPAEWLFPGGKPEGPLGTNSVFPACRKAAWKTCAEKHGGSNGCASGSSTFWPIGRAERGWRYAERGSARLRRLSKPPSPTGKRGSMSTSANSAPQVRSALWFSFGSFLGRVRIHCLHDWILHEVSISRCRSSNRLF